MKTSDSSRVTRALLCLCAWLAACAGDSGADRGPCGSGAAGAGEDGGVADAPAAKITAYLGCPNEPIPPPI
jgi:hypothetical protein